MKKAFSLLLTLVLCLSLCACSGGNSSYEQQLDKYGWVIDLLEEKDYDALIYQLEKMKEEDKKAELKNRGIVKVAITIDNWDQYFEYFPTCDGYIRNSFDEITYMDMFGGLKLKNEYTIVEDGGTTVNFEIETYQETRNCTVDFSTGTFEYGEVITQSGINSRTSTTRFDDYNNPCCFGFSCQVNSDNGKQITTEVTIAAISKMLRAEGVLYIYQN